MFKDQINIALQHSIQGLGKQLGPTLAGGHLLMEQTVQLLAICLSDGKPELQLGYGPGRIQLAQRQAAPVGQRQRRIKKAQDRKSTRLNSSHVRISYAVFCLKKKK